MLAEEAAGTIRKQETQISPSCLGDDHLRRAGVKLAPQVSAVEGDLDPRWRERFGRVGIERYFVPSVSVCLDCHPGV